MTIERNVRDVTIKENRLKNAKTNILGKTLWLVPNWECNRAKNPCGICFATDIMQDAKVNGYSRASSDLLEKTKILSKLPWSEIVITGGEPTSDLQLLKTTLSAIDPKKDIRIITNGDWILDKTKKDKVVSLINSSKRQVQIDISAHDSHDTLNRKIESLWDDLPIGLQSREKEDEESSLSKNLLIRTFPTVEEHQVLKLGQAKLNNKNSYVLLGMKKLINYSKSKNHGIYLISGKGGARVIANHEAPYLVGQTPADLANPLDDASVVKEKVINFYADLPKSTEELNLDSEVIEYATAAFKSGVPIDFDGYEAWKTNMYLPLNARIDFIKQNKKLMNNYYQVISELSDTPVNILKNIVSQRLAEKIFEIESLSSLNIPTLRYFTYYPMTFFVARNACRDSGSLASTITNELWQTYRGSHVVNPKLTFKDSDDPLDAFLQSLDSDGKKNFISHLGILDISKKELSFQLKELLKERRKKTFEQVTLFP